MSDSPLSSARAVRAKIAERLKQAMLDAGLTGLELADLCGWHKSKSSRIARGITPPSDDDIRVWCTACGVPELAADLIAASRTAESMYVEWRQLHRNGLRQVHEKTTPLYQRTRTFRVYASNLVPGMLQTSDYATGLLRSITAFQGTPDDVDRAVDARLARSRVVFEVDAPNLLKGLAQHGYRSSCIGGVTYFSRETPLGSVLPDLFDEDHWRPEFCSPAPDSTRHQVDQALEIAEHHAGRPLYLFVNVSATHVPHGHYLGDSRDTTTSQQAALAYADAHLGRLVTELTAKNRWLIILCADHGDAFGEDGFHGRGIAHPVVMNVPYAAMVR
jgi:transcriptional regulator with XRE-family HTH domain